MDKNFSIKNYAEAIKVHENLLPFYTDGNGTPYQSLTQMIRLGDASNTAITDRLKSGKCKTVAEALADFQETRRPHRKWTEIVAGIIYRNFAKPAEDFAIDRNLLREHVQKGHLDMNTAVFIQYVQGCKLVGPNGETMTIPELAEKFHKSEEDVISLLDKTAPATAVDAAMRTWRGITFATEESMIKIVGRGMVKHTNFFFRRKNGWTIEQALEEPARRYGKNA